MAEFLIRGNWHVEKYRLLIFIRIDLLIKKLMCFIGSKNCHFLVCIAQILYQSHLNLPGFANFIDEWSHSDFCFTNFGVILEYLESSITMKKAIFRLSCTWSWHGYTVVYTWKAQIHDGSHRVNFDRNLPSSCFVVQYNSLILMI